MTFGRTARMTRVAAAMFGAGAALALLTLALPHPENVEAKTIVVPAIGAIGIAGLLLASKGRIPKWTVHLIPAYAMILITSGMAYSGGVIALPFGVLYIWIAVFVCYFFTPRAAITNLTLIAVLYGAMLWLDGGVGGFTMWTLITGSCFGIGGIVGWLSRQIHRMARTDGLTGVANRRCWDEDMKVEMARAKRTRDALTVAIIDIDHFKRVNDTKGHQVGDRLLKELVAGWSEKVRPTDVLARWGGDEFSLLLPNCGLSEGREVVERLREASSGESQFSAGLATWDFEESLSDLVSRADQALYKAKQTRGRTEAAVA